MALLTTQTLSTGGTSPTYSAAAGGGDSFVFADDVALHIKNGGGSPITVTITAQVNCNQSFLHDQVLTVNNGADKFVANFDARFIDNNQHVNVTYSAVTSVTVAVLKA